MAERSISPFSDASIESASGPTPRVDCLAVEFDAVALEASWPKASGCPARHASANEAGASRSTVPETLRALIESGFLEHASPKILVVRGAAETPARRRR